MMKKILSLCLALVMLLGVVAMTVSAEGEAVKFDSYNLSLGDDIALNFYFANLDAAVEYTATINGEEADLTIDGTNATVKVSALTPAMVEDDFTVALLANGEVVASGTKSVLDYCDWALNNMDLSNDVHTLVVDLLNYAAATQAYAGGEATANAGLSDLQKALASAAPAIEAEYLLSGNEDGATVTWNSASLVLSESIAYKFCYTLPETYTDEVKFVVTLNGKSFTYTDTYWTAEDGDFFLFTALTPADLRTDITVVAQDAEGNALSSTWTFSGERYANYVIANESEEAANLVNAIMAYCDSAIAYNAVAETNPEHEFKNQALRDITAGALSPAEIYRLSMIPITSDTNKISSGNCNSGFAPYAYKKAGISVSDYMTETVSGAVKKVFSADPKSLNSSVKKLDAVSDENPYYPLLAVKDAYGGSWIDFAVELVTHKDGDKTIVDSVTNKYRVDQIDFKIGDLLYFSTSDGEYYVALYQGNGQFLLNARAQWLDRVTAADLLKFIDGGTYTRANGTELTFTFCRYYFVLRPSQLANQAN